MSVDTLTLARELRAADLGAVQAEAIASAIGRAVAETATTKADLAQMGAEIRSEVASVKADVELSRVELAALRRDVVRGNDAVTAELNASIKANVESMRSSMILWLIGVALALASLTVAMLKL